MQIELELLTDEVGLAQLVWHVAVPEHEELLSLALVECLAHELDATLLVLDERLVESLVVVDAHFVLQLPHCLLVVELDQVLKYGSIYVLLRGSELLQVHAARRGRRRSCRLIPVSRTVLTSFLPSIYDASSPESWLGLSTCSNI